MRPVLVRMEDNYSVTGKKKLYSESETEKKHTACENVKRGKSLTLLWPCFYHLETSDF